jgi:hypothetical protein
VSTRMLLRFSDGGTGVGYSEDALPQPGDTLVSIGRAWSIEAVELHVEGTWLVTLSPAEAEADD